MEGLASTNGRVNKKTELSIDAGRQTIEQKVASREGPFKRMLDDFRGDPGSLTKHDRKTLAEHLITVATANADYMLDNYINAAQLDPERYQGIAAAYVLE